MNHYNPFCFDLLAVKKCSAWGQNKTINKIDKFIHISCQDYKIKKYTNTIDFLNIYTKIAHF